ncbi:hypothetical protein U9M48_017849 [Paspalum notatum var. saurae]|uniref:Uncharacterized protein n=1 Tax=Paspalum notatum var. saurae TaxID=547442 RepID=A0AAQ3WPR1_PASNO
MACLARFLVVCLSLVILAVASFTSPAEAMGLPQPPPDLNFTIAVEGVVWCKTCRYAGYVKSMDASPLPNAAALLRCRRGGDGRALSVWNTTDADGYFLIQADWQSTPFKSKDCRVFVPVSPVRGCSVAVTPHRKQGATLKFRRFVPVSDGELQGRYSAGNFTFAPKDPAKATLVIVTIVGCLPSPSSGMGFPRPQPNLNFTIGVEGVVWCKGCRYRGYVESRDASPLRSKSLYYQCTIYSSMQCNTHDDLRSYDDGADASALLRCRRGHRALSVWNTTNAHGYFLIQTGAQAAPFTSSHCKVYVPRSPARGCRVAVRPARKKGSPLRFRRFLALPGGLQGRYSAGSFTFAPHDSSKC